MRRSGEMGLAAPVDGLLAAMDGVRLGRQSTVGPMQDKPRREPQKAL